MKCVDVNILLNAYFVDAPHHDVAYAVIEDCCASDEDVLLDGSNMIMGPEAIAVMPTFRTLMTRYEVRGNDVPDLFLAACAVAVGATLISFDRGFSKFAEVTWWNPLAEPVARL